MGGSKVDLKPCTYNPRWLAKQTTGHNFEDFLFCGSPWFPEG